MKFAADRATTRPSGCVSPPEIRRDDGKIQEEKELPHVSSSRSSPLALC